MFRQASVALPTTTTTTTTTTVDDLDDAAPRPPRASTTTLDHRRAHHDDHSTLVSTTSTTSTATLDHDPRPRRRRPPSSTTSTTQTPTTLAPGDRRRRRRWPTSAAGAPTVLSCLLNRVPEAAGVRRRSATAGVAAIAAPGPPGRGSGGARRHAGPDAAGAAAGCPAGEACRRAGAETWGRVRSSRVVCRSPVGAPHAGCRARGDAGPAMRAHCRAPCTLQSGESRPCALNRNAAKYLHQSWASRNASRRPSGENGCCRFGAVTALAVAVALHRARRRSRRRRGLSPARTRSTISAATSWVAAGVTLVRAGPVDRARGHLRRAPRRCEGDQEGERAFR